MVTSRLIANTARQTVARTTPRRAGEASRFMS